MLQYSIIRQKPYCCVPACVQMILRRRSLREVSQEDIARTLGLIIPPALRDQFPGAIVIEGRGALGYGCTLAPPHSLTDLFRAEGFRLREDFIPSENFVSEDDLGEFATHHLLRKDDMIVSYDTSVVYGSGKRTSHVSLISGVWRNKIRLADPQQAMPALIDIEMFLRAMWSDRGGVWVVSTI